MSDYQPWVVCAANRHRVSGLIVCGARHFDDTMRTVMRLTGGFPYWLDCDQGFLDQRGTFLTRQEAWVIAEANGQIKKRVGGDTIDGGTLFSENLY